MIRIQSVLRSRPFVEGVILAVSIGLILAFQWFYLPHFTNIRYEFDGKTMTGELPISLPVQTKNRKLEMNVWATLSMHSWQSTLFRMRGDDCILAVSVNGKNVPVATPCEKNLGTLQDIDLAKFLHPGTNEIHARVLDTQGGMVRFSMEPSSNDIYLTLANLLLLLLPLIYLLSIVHKKWGHAIPSMTVLIAAAFAIRIAYMTVTPVGFRAYDTDGHLEYIFYMAQHWAVPAVGKGWEFHQGPSYYFLMAIIAKVATFVGYGKLGSLLWMQYASVYLSCITVTISVWCGEILFGKNKRSLLVFVALFASFPGLVQFSSRISNDVLFQLLAILFFACLLQWWKAGTTRWLLITAAIVGFGFITKSNCFLFAPILGLCILFRSDTKIETKVRWLAMLGGMIALIAGWLVILRYMQNYFGKYMAPFNGMNPGLSVADSFAAYLFFDPFHVIRLPFTDSWRDGFGREYFWMYLFKTSLFGEFSFAAYRGLSNMGSMLAALLLGSLLIAAKGAITLLRKNDFFMTPYTVTFVITMTAALMYRGIHPYSSNQDFRFSLLLLPLFALCATKACEGNTRLDIALRTWLLSFAGCAVIFFLVLSIGGLPTF